MKVPVIEKTWAADVALTATLPKETELTDVATDGGGGVIVTE